MDMAVVHFVMGRPAQAAAAADSGTRERILAAASRRFATFGYRRTGIAEIARDVGLAAGTVYRYFPGKEEVFLEVVRRVNEAWVAAGRAALAGPGTAHERLRRLGQASVQFNQDNALLLAILRRDTEIVCAPLAEQIYDGFVRANVAMIAEAIRGGTTEGTFRSVDPERAAFVLFSAGNALSMQHHYPYFELLPLFEEILYEGLLARPAPSRTRARHVKGGHDDDAIPADPAPVARLGGRPRRRARGPHRS
jgi:AcrR family transcriptional regulator